MKTYTKNGRVVRYLRWLRLFFLLFLSYADVLDITTPEDNVIVDAGRRRNLFHRVATSALSSKRNNILKGYCRGFRVDLM